MNPTKRLLVCLIPVIFGIWCCSPNNPDSETSNNPGQDELLDVTSLTDGRLAATGYIQDNFISKSNVLVVMIDTNGNWQNEYFFGGQGDERGLAIMENTPDELIVGGYSTSLDARLKDFYLVKIKQSGLLIKESVFGGEKNEEILGLISLNDGGGLAVGYTESSEIFGGQEEVAILIRFNSELDTVWTRTYIPTGGTNFASSFSGIEIADDGGFVLVGYVKNIKGKKNVFLIKVNNLGEEEWTKIYSSNEDEGAAEAIVKIRDSSGYGYMVSGYFETEFAHVFKIDSIGNLIQSIPFWGYSTGFNISSSLDSTSVLLAGWGNQLLSTGWAAKLDLNGTSIWSKSYTKESSSRVMGIYELSSGQIVLIGSLVNVESGDFDAAVWLADKQGELITP